VCHHRDEKSEEGGSDGIFLPDGEQMEDLGNGEYKYLGVLEASDIKMKEKTRKE